MAREVSTNAKRSSAGRGRRTPGRRWTLLVENRGGAGGVIGMDAVAKSAPDGYTLCFCAAPIALNTALGMKLPYDPYADFAPISLVASIPALIAVHPDTPYRSVQNLVDAAKANPAGLTYAFANVGAITHLMGEALRAKTGANMTYVAYKGAGQAIVDVVSGRVPVFFDALVPTGAQVQAGKLRAIAIASRERSPLLPDVATVVEQGFPELLGSGFYGLLAPGKTPRAIVEKLHAAAVASVNQTDVREKLLAQGYEVIVSTPEEYTAYIRREIERWTPIVKAAGIKVEQ